MKNEVALGCHVEVELIGESGGSEYLSLDIVPDSEADFSSGLLGVGTPLAQATAGQRAGSLVPYRVGDILEVKILTVAPGARTPTGEAAADRQAVIQKAISRSDLDDALRLALTVDVKWGDYVGRLRSGGHRVKLGLKKEALANSEWRIANGEVEERKTHTTREGNSSCRTQV